MTIEKWKTFPCKTCLLSYKCKSWCFDWATNDVLKVYIKENNLKGICLACENKLSIMRKTVCHRKYAMGMEE